MSNNNISCGLNSSAFDPLINNPYYYTQQSQSCSYSPVQMNMMYLMQQNMLLQQQLLKRRKFQAQYWYSSALDKNKKIKIQDPQSECSDVLSKDSHAELPKHTQQTQATFKQNYNIKKKIKRNKGEKNQTKNIPKNYGKAIVTFIESNKQLVRRVVSKFPSVTFTSFMNLLRSKKRRINSIADLREFWLQSEEKDFSEIARILSNIFLRFYSLQYIFNSRISNYAGHVKYRGRLVQALRNPKNFTSIKQY